jgi:hypothetical protein
MTQSNSHTFNSENGFSQLLNQVVLLLLGTPPTLRVSRVVVAVQAVDSRIMMGGANHACA